MYEDRELKCADCGAEWVFTAGEQQFYEERGFKYPPRRCKDCRRQRKAGEGSGGGGGARSEHSAPAGARPSFPARCSACGAETTVPFEPDPARATFCRACYQERRKK